MARCIVPFSSYNNQSLSESTMPGKALAYINSYTAKHSADPWTDYRIGKEHGLVGCGRPLVRMDVPWFTKVAGHLIWHGCIKSRSTSNPWANPLLHTFDVECHLDLGLLHEVFVDAHVSESILPKGQSISLNDPSTERLVGYARAKYAESMAATATATATATASSSSATEDPSGNSVASTNATSSSTVSEKDARILKLEEETSNMKYEIAGLEEKIRRLKAALDAALA